MYIPIDILTVVYSMSCLLGRLLKSDMMSKTEKHLVTGSDTITIAIISIHPSIWVPDDPHSPNINREWTTQNAI